MTPNAPSPIALTCGEPAGIGPDLCLQLAGTPAMQDVVVIADPQLLAERAQLLGLSVQLIEAGSSPAPTSGPVLHYHPITLKSPVRCGHLDSNNAAYVLETLRHATEGCLSGHYRALVTGPLHKGVINDAGIPFSGHTEYLAELTQTDQVVMMLATEGLRVALATTHLPLSKVSEAIQPQALSKTLRILHQDLQRRFGIAQPRILVAGLNPHAGEGGHLGHEEREIIEPVLESLRQQGMQLIGPLPADTLFTPRYLEQADAVLAMYHDQGLPVLKYKGFGRAINITLGLPIIRTSVDHGTALPLAGSGKAESGSLVAALEAAQRLSRGEPA